MIGPRCARERPRKIEAEEALMTPIRYSTADADGLKVLYREAGNTAAAKLLLLHNTGHFALETHALDIAANIREYLRP